MRTRNRRLITPATRPAASPWPPRTRTMQTMPHPPVMIPQVIAASGGTSWRVPARAATRTGHVPAIRGVFSTPWPAPGGYPGVMVTRTWPEPVERVAAFLKTAGVEARIEEFPGGTPTARDAAEACGCELSQIVKSLLFECGDRRVLVLVPGDRRADRKKVAVAAGTPKARIADAEEVERATGYVPGAVAPFPLS